MKTAHSFPLILKEQGLSIARVQSDAQWEAYHRIRQQEIFSMLPFTYDPHHPALSHPAHYHFVLYEHETIIGVAEIDFIPPNEAGLRPFALDKPFQGRGFGAHFLTALEEWLRGQNRIILRLHANPPAVSFYRRLGYTEQPFVEARLDVIATVDMAKKL